ncbi:MAG: hypothetical protein LBP76_03785 [Treponema sp.]|jgi:hypothetical protein|nr:hypothetical protein [Treponema sp.]
MVRLKCPRGLYFLLFLVLRPCVLSGALTEFVRDIKESGVLSSPVSGEKTSESGGTTPLISENPLFYSQPLTQNRAQLHRLWRQFLALIICVLLLKAYSKLTLRKYYLHNYFPREFFHSLLISLLLGGRAPPLSAY